MTKQKKKITKKRTKSKATPIVLAYDLGGTKVAVGVVNARGKILEEVRVPVVIDQGKGAVLKQLVDLGQDFLSRYPQIKRVGIASAGPLDPNRGLLFDPTNFVSAKDPQGWGVVPIARILSKGLKRRVVLENDAAAAMLAEHWKGAAKGYKNAMILTLGTGLGTGIIANGKLLRSGRGLHPEAGHMVIRDGDASAPCGCGNLGCAEAYLSGRNFARRNRSRFSNPSLKPVDIARLARSGDPRARAAFDEYARLMAVALANYVAMFSPEIFVFTGGFAEAADLFVDNTLKNLAELIKRRRTGIDLMPKLAISKLDNEAGLLGGAFVALQSCR